MAAVDLPAPRLGGAGSGWGVAVFDAGGACALRVFDAGLACCAVEVAAALRRWQAQAPAGAPGEMLNVFVVAGTVTDKLAPFVLAAYQQTPEPRRVLSFGACANSGGPYWDSYCVTKGVDQFVPVDVYVPGCPPRPEALLAGVEVLLGREPPP
ncbi:MAG TPA: NADH-quinone oxidoreductase subunit NuoB [Streptosporangiaceae bacterium]